jgi:hypothetical protein
MSDRTEFVKIATALIASELSDLLAAESAGDPTADATIENRAAACAEYLAARFLDAPARAVPPTAGG